MVRDRSQIANPSGAPCLCHGLTSGGSHLLLVLNFWSSGLGFMEVGDPWRIVSFGSEEHELLFFLCVRK